jgi:uncharacterized protein YidB (DUF937 family)
MDLMATATKMLGDKLSGANLDALPEALKGLLGSSGGDLDIAGLVAKLAGAGGLQSAVTSWLGSGGNEAISADKIKKIFGGKIGEFASKVGVSPDQASSGLAEVLPQLVDKFSEGGSLLGGLGGAGDLMEKAGGIGGLMGKAKGFFGK